MFSTVQRLHGAMALRVACLLGFLLLASCSGTDETHVSNEDSAAVLRSIDSSVPLQDQIRRLPGVYVNSDGELRIRGATGPPLFIVDGTTSVVSDVSFLNPQEVESVEIVSGPETAIYGVRGGRGVILVTTKDGSSAAER